MADTDSFFAGALESDEERFTRWGADVLAGLRLTDGRGLLIHARSKEKRAALYAALEVLAERDEADASAAFKAAVDGQHRD